MKIKLEVAYTNEETISQLDSALEEIEDIKVEKFEQNGFDGHFKPCGFQCASVYGQQK